MKTRARGYLGEWLAGKCEKERFSLRQAASHTRLSHATIRDLIRGVRPTPGSIEKLAVAFGGNGEHKLVLQDKLLVLAGYRSERPDHPEPSEALARLLDQVRNFDEAKFKIMTRFADFLNGMEAEK